MGAISTRVRPSPRGWASHRKSHATSVSFRSCPRMNGVGARRQTKPHGDVVRVQSRGQSGWRKTVLKRPCRGKRRASRVPPIIGDRRRPRHNRINLHIHRLNLKNLHMKPPPNAFWGPISTSWLGNRPRRLVRARIKWNRRFRRSGQGTRGRCLGTLHNQNRTRGQKPEHRRTTATMADNWDES